MFYILAMQFRYQTHIYEVIQMAWFIFNYKYVNYFMNWSDGGKKFLRKRVFIDPQNMIKGIVFKSIWWC